LETIRLIKLNQCPIYRMLSLEEHLLSKPCQNYLLINYGTPEAIVLGKSNDQKTLVIDQPNVPLIRRFSGGGTVYVDESTIFVSWILSKELAHAKCVDTLFDWTVSGLQKAHPQLPIHRIETDYVLENKKIGGTAQYVKKDRILHHTSFLFHFCKKKMELLKSPLKVPSYRQNRSHEEFLTSLNHHFKSPKDFVEPYIEQLKLEFHVEEISILELLVDMQQPKQTVFL